MQSLAEFITARSECAATKMVGTDEYRNLSGEIAELTESAYASGQGTLIAKADDLYTRLTVLATEAGYQRGFADAQTLRCSKS